jgi:hypothetical protein
MGAVTNVSATRRTVRALREAERLTEADAAMVQLVRTTARALDDAVASGEKAYGIGKASTSHREALKTLLDYAQPEPPDSFDVFLAELRMPTPGTTDGSARLG